MWRPFSVTRSAGTARSAPGRWTPTARRSKTSTRPPPRPNRSLLGDESCRERPRNTVTCAERHGSCDATGVNGPGCELRTGGRMADAPRVYTVHEVANILQMHEETVRTLLRSGRLK